MDDRGRAGFREGNRVEGQARVYRRHKEGYETGGGFNGTSEGLGGKIVAEDFYEGFSGDCDTSCHGWVCCGSWEGVG